MSQFKNVKFLLLFLCGIFTINSSFAKEKPATKTKEVVKEQTVAKVADKEIPAEKGENNLAKIKMPAKEKTAISHKLWYSLSDSDLEYLKKINSLLENSRYDDAMFYAKELKSRLDKAVPANNDSAKISFSEAVIDMVLWRKFSGEIDPGRISFSDISRFAIDNPFYPNISSIKRNVEKVIMENDISIDASEQYLKLNPAGTTQSKVYVLKSKIDSLARKNLSPEIKIEQGKTIQNLIGQTWEKENFAADEEKKFLEKYSNQLTQINHINRIERLLWDNKLEEAKRIFRFVDEDHADLFKAIIEIQNSPKYIDKIISSVPRKLRSNELLINRRITWYRSKDKVDDVIDSLLDIPANSKFSDKWWSLRRLYMREMLKQKEYKTAYKLASNHGLPKESSDFWEAEWTAGWIALRFVNEAETAYSHFENLYKNVSQPVTLSRAAYWLGLAAEELGDKEIAIGWYKVAAKYPIFFYGQLAIHKHRALDPIGAQGDIILPKDPSITGRDMAKIAENRAAQVAYLLAILGDKTSATKIFEWVINNSPTEGQIAVVMKIINEFQDRQMDARVSRIAAKKNVFFIKDKFQIVREVSDDKYAPLVHAIIKQESGFAPTAVSQVGALGFMQLMPNTAKLVAKEMGIPYDKHKLATDITYNVRLGSFYIQKLIERFDGSEMLAIASYNAGPNATKRWINEFYDPRKEDDINKVVDWIELITYSETRNYVQRIMENLIVYKYLMSRANYDDVK